MVVVPVLLMAVMLAQEAVGAELAVRAWIEAGGIQNLPAQLSKVPLVGEVLQDLIGRYLLKPDALEELVRSSAQVVSGFFVDQLSNLLKNALFWSVIFSSFSLPSGFCTRMVAAGSGFSTNSFRSTMLRSRRSSRVWISQSAPW